MPNDINKLTTKTFNYPVKMRWTWGASLLPLLISYWLLFCYLKIWQWHLPIFILASMLGSALSGLCLYLLLTFRHTVTLLLVDEILIHKRFLQTRTINYGSDIFYARTKPSLTLITPKGELKIDKKLAGYQELSTILQTRRPNLFTPRMPLPWVVWGNRDELVGLLFATFLLLFIGVASIFAALAGESYGVLLVSLMFLGVAGSVVFAILQCPLNYTLSAAKIVVHTLLKTSVYQVASLELFYRDTSTLKTKGSTQTLHRVCITFKDGPDLEIRQDNISYPFDEFYAIFKAHYAPHVADALPWVKKRKKIPYHHLATGSVNKFEWYFTGQSAVEVASIEDICDWLRGCKYESDKVLFTKSDYWQHPLEFEKLRQGDCEDHALWAWRKLVGLGLEAEYVLGHWQEGFHAWVMFEKEGELYIFETTRKLSNIMIPALKIKDQYQPKYGVDHNFVTYRYWTKF